MAKLNVILLLFKGYLYLHNLHGFVRLLFISTSIERIIINSDLSHSDICFTNSSLQYAVFPSFKIILIIIVT